MSMVSEFKEFALKSNFVDMATGIIIGGAIGTVVQSLVKDVVMPPIGYMMGGVDFSDIVLPLGIKIGSFINNCISFVIVMGAVFMIIKAINAAKKQFEKDAEAEEAAAEPPKQEILLEEIRDLLKK